MQDQNRFVSNTMQTPTCECPSITSGFSYGVGLAIGVVTVATVTVGILSLLKKR